MRSHADETETWLTTVYGPTRDEDKPAFLQELHELRQLRQGPWILNGDFNWIYRAQDKNNDRLNRRRMGQFRRFLNEASLKELHLQGRLFTWSNEREHPTLERIDRVFVPPEWDMLHPHSELSSFATLCSDHAPLLLRTDSTAAMTKRFHFRAFWPKLPGYLDMVQRVWHCPLQDADPFRRLDWLLRNTSRALQSWSQRCIGNIRIQLEIAKEVIHRLEMAMDRRPLTAHEEDLRKKLKLKALGLSSLQRNKSRACYGFLREMHRLNSSIYTLMVAAEKNIFIPLNTRAGRSRMKRQRRTWRSSTSTTS